jgi:hypothetical protein
MLEQNLEVGPTPMEIAEGKKGTDLCDMMMARSLRRKLRVAH